MSRNNRQHKINEYHPHLREEADYFNDENVSIQIRLYNKHNILEFEMDNTQDSLSLLSRYPDYNIWVNIDGINKDVVNRVCKHFNVHKLFINDILSVGQRAKMDDIDDGTIFILVPVLRWDSITNVVTKEQLSLIAGKNFIVTFQEEPNMDPFESIRTAIRNAQHPLRQRNIDFLLYYLMDAVVDDYFNLLDELSVRIEELDSKINSRRIPSWFLDRLSKVRKDVFFVKRTISPVRDVVNSLWMKDIGLIDDNNKKYFKDILDHILLAIEYNENYRETTVNLQDLYINQLNTKTNEVMKILTIVTTLMAPATLIGSIYGMNFEKMPLLDYRYGYEVILFLAFGSTVGMLWYFRKRRWF